ncbi:MAG TPA: FRG domain-containing protein [Thermoanaerobaculia bacterium]|nr:FRG domain-containing protein [Thermoanaerobaculia bacterium]
MPILVTEVISCVSWDDFKSRIHREYSEEIVGISPLFRGHAKVEWKLASPWDRRLEHWASTSRSAKKDREGKNNILSKVLADFKDLAIGLPGIRAKDLDNDDDWWALGRHYGLLTPLLDWTKSPYVAAFFAFTGFVERVSPGATTSGEIDPRKLLCINNDDRVAIWSFMLSQSTEYDEEDPKDLQIEILSSRIDFGHRQRAQRGVFTRLTSNDHFDLESYLTSRRLMPPPLRKYTIPGAEAGKAIMELRMMNITFATLYPDLDGAALQANFELAAFALTTFLPPSGFRISLRDGARDVLRKSDA